MTMVKAETHNGSAYREWVSVEYSATYRASVCRTPSQGSETIEGDCTSHRSGSSKGNSVFWKCHELTAALWLPAQEPRGSQSTFQYELNSGDVYNPTTDGGTMDIWELLGKESGLFYYFLMLWSLPGQHTPVSIWPAQTGPCWLFQK